METLVILGDVTGMSQIMRRTSHDVEGLDYRGLDINRGRGSRHAVSFSDALLCSLTCAYASSTNM